MSNIIGLDRSRWQGATTAAQVAAQVAAGVKFVGLKASQGGSYRDPTFAANVEAYRGSGILVYPYHFTTTDNPMQQYDNFLGAIQSVSYDWRLPPALDCEAYTALGSRMLTGRLGLSYPGESTVWWIGDSLRIWMQGQLNLSAFVRPMIYTNASSGNVIFKTAKYKWSEFPLWVANWETSRPYLPAQWRAADKWIVWQDNVVAGQPFGIDGQVDHNVWGNLFPFPSEQPEPPDPPDPPDPPSPDTINVTVEYPDGKKYAGTLSKEG